MSALYLSGRIECGVCKWIIVYHSGLSPEATTETQATQGWENESKCTGTALIWLEHILQVNTDQNCD